MYNTHCLLHQNRLMSNSESFLGKTEARIIGITAEQTKVLLLPNAVMVQ